MTQIIVFKSTAWGLGWPSLNHSPAFASFVSLGTSLYFGFSSIKMKIITALPCGCEHLRGCEHCFNLIPCTERCGVDTYLVLHTYW